MSLPRRNQLIILVPFTGEYGPSITDREVLGESIPLRSRLDSFFLPTIFSPPSVSSRGCIYQAWHNSSLPDYKRQGFHARSSKP